MGFVDVSGDEDEGVDGFGFRESGGVVSTLRLFNAQTSTSNWPWWDGHANSAQVAHFIVVDTKIQLSAVTSKKIMTWSSFAADP